jgi:hypothetical protein
MLHPDKVLYIAKKCHEKNISFEIPTNGFWGLDEKLLKLLKEEIKPTVISFSLDDFHKVDYKTLLNILHYFENDKNIFITYEEILGFENKFKKEFEKFNIGHLTEYLTNTGRSKIRSGPKIEGPKVLNCMVRGLDVRPNGQIFALCPNHQGCHIGNYKNSINDLQNYILKNMKVYNLKKGKRISNIFEICGNNLWRF